MEEKPKKMAIYEGEARIGEVMKGLAQIQLRPEDFTSPVAMQMALSRIYEALMRTLHEGPRKTFVAEIRFTDSLGQTVVFAVDLGESPPPFQSNRVKARITVEMFEEEL
uniref:Uncharacterized protein n=1 Tax=Fervidicoccus fontis TaxID=683846 RepID=A0A7J3ZKY0_9CREN